MASFPLFVSRDNRQPQRFDLYAIGKSNLTEELPVSRILGDPWPLPPNSAVVLESDGQMTDALASSAIEVRKALRNARFKCLPIFAPATQDSRWFVISFLTVPKSLQEELSGRFATYTKTIFQNPKFNPVFSYLALLAPASDVLLSVWGFEGSQDADIYMPSSEHVVFGDSVKSYITHADFFQAALIDFTAAKL